MKKRKKSLKLLFIRIIEMSREKILSQRFLLSARKEPQQFTRNRKMPFVDLFYFMLNQIKSSTQTCLDHYFELIGKGTLHMTQQSFSEARKKIRWEAFKELNDDVVDMCYTYPFEKWHGYRLLSIDGSKIQLPDDKSLRVYFGTTGEGHSAATAQASALYDVCNGILIDTQIEPVATGERALALRHIEKLRNLPSFHKELVLFDRGYASFNLIKVLSGNGISFVMRVKKGFNNDIDRLGDGVHSVTLKRKGEADIVVRVVKFPLKSGENETLVTNLTDKRMGVRAFKELYFKRWPIETKYDEIKNKLEVENFSGRTEDTIRQDFHATMYLSNMIAVARKSAQEMVDTSQEDKDNKYDYHVNVNHAIGVFKDRFITACLIKSNRKRGREAERIIYLLTEHVVPYRPDRTTQRNPRPRKAKFRHNQKSNC